ncbi:hypothetical protein [Janthinobacterium sp. PAMC25594]|uniref:hypothetical protein n=1 Tax=Janthinobacterium sp. PAMC25594 TaxID=2861284 RepID=UPI001C62C834|nr:hypothetical protein [Janthinobacterium sp. PAMC25594]QYG08047.1 hypothetical protein KY494_04405 [Janthinobacterium sp. PAMC25594]
MNDVNFLAWLKNPLAIPLVLIEVAVRVSGVETTKYLSTGVFVTGPADTPSNLAYEPIVSTGVQFSEQLSLDGEASLSTGDIELSNANGERDGWLGAGSVWTNRPVRAWIGDPRWPRADFRMIFNGIVADIAPKGRDMLALKLRDKMQRLNAPATESKLASSLNADAVLPLSFGEVHNITPLLVDPVMLQYQVHDGACESIFEVRDNGLPVAAVAVNSTGKLTLNANPVGAITVSVQGDKPGAYANTIAALVQRLVTGYGSAADRFTSADLDIASLAAFDAAHQQPVGLYLQGRTNVISACQSLTASVGAQMALSRLGQLRLIQIALPAPGTPTEIRPAHIVGDTLEPTVRPEVVAAVKLGFCKNWTVQPGLQTSIPAQHKELFATEWLTATSTNAPVRTIYRQTLDPVQQDTMLMRRADADAEAARQLALWSSPRMVYEFEGLPEMLMLELGQPIVIYNQRFGMEAGVPGIVISLAPSWESAHCKVGILV